MRQIIDNAYRVADRCLPQDAAIIRKLADDISRAANTLCDLRQEGKGQTPQADQLARQIREQLGNLNRAISNAVAGVDKAGHQQAAHTVSLIINLLMRIDDVYYDETRIVILIGSRTIGTSLPVVTKSKSR